MKVTEKITGAQLGMLMFSFVVSTILLTVPEVMVSFAKQSAWLSVFPALLTGIVSIFVMTALTSRYPSMTIIEYSSQILGKWIGKLFGLYFTLYVLFLIASIGYEHTVFISTVIFEKTPTSVEVVTFVGLCGIAAFVGIEVIGRCNQFLLLLAVVFLIPLFILSQWDANPEHLRPVLAEGIVPIMEGAVLPSGWMGQFLFLGWLLPYLSEQEKARKVSFITLGGIALVITMTNLLTIMVFGPITSNLSYSFLRVIQYIGEFTPIERLEVIIVALWTMGFFIKGAVLTFALSLSVSQLFALSDYRRIVVPITLWSMVSSVWIFETTAEWQTWIVYGYAFLAFFTHIVLPVLLLLTDSFKKGLQ